jgi:hypothetical protein
LLIHSLKRAVTFFEFFSGSARTRFVSANFLSRSSQGLLSGLWFSSVFSTTTVIDHSILSRRWPAGNDILLCGCGFGMPEFKL